MLTVFHSNCFCAAKTSLPTEFQRPTPLGCRVADLFISIWLLFCCFCCRYEFIFYFVFHQTKRAQLRSSAHGKPPKAPTDPAAATLSACRALVFYFCFPGRNGNLNHVMILSERRGWVSEFCVLSSSCSSCSSASAFAICASSLLFAHSSRVLFLYSAFRVSYFRNWHKSRRTRPTLMAKCCGAN